MEKIPLKLLQKSVKSLILVKLKNGHEFKGHLEELDNYMNLVLVKAEKIVDGQVVNKYPTIFIRGNNILFIKPKVHADYPKSSSV
ncbi:MAG: LSM domain-containing protein [Candidatus Ranarchaeia archaeon]